MWDSSAKPVPFVSTIKKAGGARPQRGSKGEEVTPIPPVPGGGGTGGEVRKELETPTIKRRAKSTNLCPSVLTSCVCYSPNCLCSPAAMSLHFVISSQPCTSCFVVKGHS